MTFRLITAFSRSIQPDLIILNITEKTSTNNCFLDCFTRTSSNQGDLNHFMTRGQSALLRMTISTRRFMCNGFNLVIFAIQTLFV